MLIKDFDGTWLSIMPPHEFVGPPTYEEWRMEQMEWAHCHD